MADPNQPTQAGKIRDRWWWIEHSVWTERMLTRLEQSQPTTVWFGLSDKLSAERNLQAAFWAVWRKGGAAGVDGQTVPQCEAQEPAQLAKLREELRSKRYRRQPARRVDSQARIEGKARAGDSPPRVTGWWKRR